MIVELYSSSVKMSIGGIVSDQRVGNESSAVNSSLVDWQLGLAANTAVYIQAVVIKRRKEKSSNHGSSEQLCGGAMRLTSHCTRPIYSLRFRYESK